MSDKKDGQPGIASLNIRMSISNFNLGKLQSNKLSDNANKEGLNITLDDSAVQRTQMDLGKWSNTNAWLIKVENQVLDCSDFEENNTKSRKHFWAQI